MQLTVEQIAERLGAKVTGNGRTVISGVAGLPEATPSDLSFLRDAKNAGALKSLESTSAGAVLVPTGFKSNGKTFLEVANPLAAFSRILQLIADEQRGTGVPGVHPLAHVASSARLGKNVSVGAFSVVEDGAEIGDDVTLMPQTYVGRGAKVGRGSYLYPQVILREYVSVGERCILHPGVVIGSDGYGFYYAEGRHNKIPQIGTVVIEDDVEIGACCAIDRATTGATVIKKGSKLDNLVHVAHNVQVGPHALLAAQVGIAGSSNVGRGVAMGGQVGIADHITIGDGVQIGAQSGVKDDTPAGVVLFGSPAQPIMDTLKQFLLIRKLPELFKEVKALKEKISRHE